MRKENPLVEFFGEPQGEPNAVAGERALCAFAGGRMREIVFSLVASVLAASLAPAQTPIGPFSGALKEHFEPAGIGPSMCLPAGVFGGSGTLCTPSGNGVSTVTGAVYACGIHALTGFGMFASDFGTNGGGIEYTFPGATIARIGGYFGMNHNGGPDITVTFFAGGTPVSTVIVPLPVNCSWNWIGWNLSGLFVDRILIKTAHPSTGFLFMDDMELDFFVCPTPAIYCTPKVNSLGCSPAISASGIPSASAGSGFVVSCAHVRNNKNGLLFYGVTGRSALPFQGGTLCVNSPITRTPWVNSGGTPAPVNNCTGHFAIDMNFYAVGGLGGGPLPALTVAGTVVDAQWWGRDPGFVPPFNSTLSDGIEYTICPR
jgi:hypothetical protein